MMGFNFVIGFLIVLLFGLVSSVLPPDVHLCKAEDTECISKVTTALIRNNPQGRPEIGLPQLDPFFVDYLSIHNGQGGAVNLDLSLKNASIEGISKATVEKAVGFTKKPATSKFELYGTAPRLILKGTYKARGQVLVLPIQGDGECDILLEGVRVAAKFKPNVIKKDGKTFLEVNKLKILIEPSGLSIKLTNLFNGDNTLGDNMNKFLNENWRDIMPELSGSINNALADVIKSIMKELFRRFSYEEIYKD